MLLLRPLVALMISLKPSTYSRVGETTSFACSLTMTNRYLFLLEHVLEFFGTYVGGLGSRFQVLEFQIQVSSITSTCTVPIANRVLNAMAEVRICQLEARVKYLAASPHQK